MIFKIELVDFVPHIKSIARTISNRKLRCLHRFKLLTAALRTVERTVPKLMIFIKVSFRPPSSTELAISCAQLFDRILLARAPVRRAIKPGMVIWVAPFFWFKGRGISGWHHTTHGGLIKDFCLTRLSEEKQRCQPIHFSKNNSIIKMC